MGEARGIGGFPEGRQITMTNGGERWRKVPGEGQPAHTTLAGRFGWGPGYGPGPNFRPISPVLRYDQLSVEKAKFP